MNEEYAMIKVSTLLLMVTLAVGCVSTNTVGSKPWHTERIAQIDRSLEQEKITELQRRQLKDEVDEKRAEYRKERRLRYKEAQLSRRRMGYFRRSYYRPSGYRRY